MAKCLIDSLFTFNPVLTIAETILHNSPKGEPKWLRASLSRPLGLCNIAALYQIALGVGIKIKANNHLEVVSN